jgi:hypothetical protein
MRLHELKERGLVRSIDSRRTFHRITSLPFQLSRVPAEFPVGAEDEGDVGWLMRDDVSYFQIHTHSRGRDLFVTYHCA